MDNIKNSTNYKTLSTYNTTYNSTDKNNDNNNMVKESYGAFSLSAAVRHPWAIPSAGDKQPVIPGVN